MKQQNEFLKWIKKLLIILKQDKIDSLELKT